MADIDLIPADYRVWLTQRDLLRRFGIIVVFLCVLLACTGAALKNMADSARARAADLRTANAITQQQHQQLETLRAQEAEYARQLALLRGLRAGAAVEDIFEVIDNSLAAGQLWFDDWSFRRAGVIVAGEQRGIETGYFVIVSEDGSNAASDFEVETHMSIRGQAKDHQALSSFVRALFGQQLIKDVSVQRTSQTEFASGHVVDFEITVVLNSAPRES